MRKIFLYVIIFFVCSNQILLFAQDDKDDSLLTQIDPYLKKIVKKSIKLYYKQYPHKKTEKEICGFDIIDYSKDLKTMHIIVFFIYNRNSIIYNKEKEIGYIRFAKKITLIYSENNKEKIIKDFKIPPVSKDILDEIEYIYPDYTNPIDILTKWSAGEPSWIEIKFKKYKSKIIGLAY